MSDFDMNKYEILLKKTHKIYGTFHQMVQTVEELSELIKAITKFINNKCDEHKIAEEIADVEIMVHQLKNILNINQNEINEIKIQKLNRLEKRLNDIKT